MASSSKKMYPKRNNRPTVDYSTFEYDSCAEGLSSDEEDELNNIYLHDLYDADDLDFDTVVVVDNIDLTLQAIAEVVAIRTKEYFFFAQGKTDSYHLLFEDVIIFSIKSCSCRKFA